jgi:Flp pilus assembly CpaF family ATPase
VADRLFEGEEAVLHVIERIVAPLGLRVDATSPWVDARLPDGSRVQTRFLSASFLPHWTLLVFYWYSITL